MTIRPEYTSRKNIGEGRHGWLRLTPAYSVTLVDEIIAGFPHDGVVLDPFGGTGTTALCVAARGQSCLSVEINPFLVWLAKAKLANYSRSVLDEVRDVANKLEGIVKRRNGPLSPIPALHRIERWWSPTQVEYLRRLKGGLTALGPSARAESLMRVAFCKTLIHTANVSRGHPSLTFGDGRQLGLAFEPDVHADAIDDILRSAAQNPSGRAKVIKGDSRRLDGVENRSIDLLVTSPPYPNRVTLIRELRPYMYWLDYLKAPTDAGALDWRAIGGTWGAATHKLGAWIEPEGALVPQLIRSRCERIRREPSKVSGLMASYVLRYFSDMATHFEEVKRVMKKGGRIFYVIGNSSFYGQLIESEKAFAEILRQLGFSDVRSQAIRKRYSKTELFEYIVSAKR